MQPTVIILRWKRREEQGAVAKNVSALKMSTRLTAMIMMGMKEKAKSIFAMKTENLHWLFHHHDHLPPEPGHSSNRLLGAVDPGDHRTRDAVS